ncbi:hypothetical protein MTO96_049530 [Rhipicephalus appendiculatus]
MLLVPGILVLLAACAQSNRDPDQLPLGIKGHGIMDLHKGDTALVFYVTQVAPGDVDCDSMLLIGGDMGDIYPGDSQNLTAYYPNLYLVDRVGYCELEIAVPDGEKLLHTVAFNTTVPRAGSKELDYFDSFQDKESPLRSMHGYPIKVNCHKGRPDPGNGWCLCDPGWESDPLEHEGFNPDLMVYHMCTVYVGVTTAATGNSSSPAHRHRHRKKGYIANIPKKLTRMLALQLERGARLMLRGKSGVAGGTADSSAEDDAASGDAGADGGGPAWYSSYVSDAQMKNAVLPALIVAVALLSCLVLTLCGVVAFECQKVSVVSTDSAL